MQIVIDVEDEYVDELVEALNNLEGVTILSIKPKDEPIPNEETLRAIEETKNGEGTIVTLEEMIAEHKKA